MTVREIVMAYLKANGYEGLYNEDDGFGEPYACSCELKELIPCQHCDVDNCKAWKKE